MNKTLLFVVVSVLVVNFVEEHFNKDSFSKTFVSAEPINNRKDVARRVADVATEEDEDEVFVRVKRSPDPNPQPRGSRGGSRYRGGSGYRGTSGGSNLSTDNILGIVFGVIVGCLFIGYLIYYCSK